MISGIVTEERVPTILLTVGDRQWVAIVDSGFNGDLELPEALRPHLNARFLFRTTSALAGGVTLDEDLFLVDFPFDGQIVLAEVTFVSGDQILIGTELLSDYRLEIDFAARIVRIERSSAAPPI